MNMTQWRALARLEEIVDGIETRRCMWMNTDNPEALREVGLGPHFNDGCYVELGTIVDDLKEIVSDLNQQ